MNTLRGSCALAIIALSAVFARAQGQSLTPQQGMLLLKNGSVIEGQITQAGDYYVVTLGASGEIRLPAQEVEAQVQSLAEAYNLRKHGMFERGAKPHLALAEWCLRHNLHASCGEQLLAAIQAEPDHPGIDAIERRLTQAMQEQAQERPAVTARRPVASSSVSPEDLDKALRELPAASIEKFAATIQPILLNRCAGGQCHGGNSTAALHLVKPPRGQIPTQRYTQRNLYSVLQQLDRERPELSPLLIEPQRRHGGTTAPVFDKFSQRQLAEIAAWIDLTLPRPVDSVPTTIPVPPAGQTLSQAVDAAPRSAVVPAAAQEPIDDKPVEVEPAASSEAEPSAEKPAAGGAAEDKLPHATASRKSSAKATTSIAEKSFTPRDPFDPEIFNRRHRLKPADTAAVRQPSQP
jgi:hypothetical protein